MEQGIERELTERIIGAAIEVHRELGPGLLESIYEECLSREFALRDLTFRRQVPVPLRYKGEPLSANMTLDMLVEDCVVVEIKAVQAIPPVHEAQLLTYLKLTGKRVGLILSFNVPVLRDGIRRFVL